MFGFFRACWSSLWWPPMWLLVRRTDAAPAAQAAFSTAARAKFRAVPRGLYLFTVGRVHREMSHSEG